MKGGIRLVGQNSFNDGKDMMIDGLNVSNWESPEVFKSLHSGDITAINATIAVWEDYHHTMDNIATWFNRFKQYEDLMVQAKSVSDIEEARNNGKVGVVLGWQNANPIGNDLNRLELFHTLGVKIIQVTYNERNLLGNGCYERNDDGLSKFGVDAIKEMNRLGILIDLSHVGDETTMETIEMSDQPVAFTHANARSFSNHARNKPDDALKLLAEKGGVVGANAFPPFLRKGFESTIEDYVDAIDDLVERIGVNHVAIGTDYTQDQPKEFFDYLFSQQGTKHQPRPVPYPDPVIHPEGMETPDKLINVRKELSKRGYSADDLAKIMGGNWLRLFKQVWRD